MYYPWRVFTNVASPYGFGYTVVLNTLVKLVATHQVAALYSVHYMPNTFVTCFAIGHAGAPSEILSMGPRVQRDATGIGTIGPNGSLAIGTISLLRCRYA